MCYVPLLSLAFWRFLGPRIPSITVVLSLIINGGLNALQSISDRLEDAIAKLTASQLTMNLKIDDLLHRMSQLEANQQKSQMPLSSSAG